jgi:hypothetical protein
MRMTRRELREIIRGVSTEVLVEGAVTDIVKDDIERVIMTHLKAMEAASKLAGAYKDYVSAYNKHSMDIIKTAYTSGVPAAVDRLKEIIVAAGGDVAATAEKKRASGAQPANGVGPAPICLST